MNTETQKVIEHEGDHYRVLATGAIDEAGRVYCHLASTTRFVQQRNGRRPIQICDWINADAMA
ncbi:hypothetical protein [Bradyrhizobium sp. 613_E4_N2_2]|uniref:hypothetical protein n=1 Tax=Bradyrhizobium sp. 613_E4_N2_2 TaxID=3240371 RepID=UPI003F8AE5B0